MAFSYIEISLIYIKSSSKRTVLTHLKSCCQNVPSMFYCASSEDSDQSVHSRCLISLRRALGGCGGGAGAGRRSGGSKASGLSVCLAHVLH